MPDNFSALIPVATIAQEYSLRQLLLYLSQVFLYRPTEAASPPLSTGLADLAPQYAPAPLGESLANFQRLMADMTSHRADFHRGAISALSARTNAVDQEDVWNLVRHLHAKTSPAGEEDETLFQARLLLALAETHDQEEREILAALAVVEDKGLNVLRLLARGDEDDDGPEPGGRSALAPAPAEPKNIEALASRLRAWAQLFLRDQRRDDHWLFATAPEVWELLADHAGGGPLLQGPRPFLALPLPGPQAAKLSPTDYLIAREQWQAEVAAPRRELLAGLLALAAGQRADLAPAREQIVQRQQGHPLWAESSGELRFYLLPMSLPALMARIAKQALVPKNNDRHSLPCGVVAVVVTT